MSLQSESKFICMPNNKIINFIPKEKLDEMSYLINR